ncbi:MAG: hypothetical protein FWE84_00495 [Firmicutes bacterium]|nr:hypothetical protein [Bacillota bacterium]
MKTVKWIYFPLVILLVLSFVVTGFVHVYAAGNTSRANDAFLDRAWEITGKLAQARLGDKTAGRDTTEKLRDYIRGDFLSGFGSARMPAASWRNYPIRDKDGINTGEYYNLVYYGTSSTADRKIMPAYFAQPEPLRSATVAAMSSSLASEHYLISAGRVVDNIVVLIPGAKTQKGDRDADAILFTAHMDPSKKIPASEDASELVMLAVMMTEIERLVGNGYDGENDLVFLFTDGRYDNSVGLYAFLHQFTGFRWSQSEDGEALLPTDLVSRIRFAANFDAIGTGHASMLLGAVGNVAVTDYASMMGGSLSSSFITDIMGGFSSGFNALKDVGITSLNLITFGNLKNEGNAADSISALGKDYVTKLTAKKADMLLSVKDYFADKPLAGTYITIDVGGEVELDEETASFVITSEKTNMVYFSVLGMFTVAFPQFAAYIFGGALVMLIFAALIASAKKKAFSLSAMGKGLLLQLLAIGAAMVSIFAVYFFTMLILAGFGAVALVGILSFTYFNPALIIGFVLLAVALQGLFYNLFRNLFGVKSEDGTRIGALKATDIARGGVLLFLLVSVILIFAYPSIGALLWLPAALAAITMLVTSVFKEKFRLATGQDIERMMFYIIPVTFALPFILPVICILFSVAPMVLAPVLILPFMLLTGMTAPYLLAIKAPATRLLEKLPKRTIRVERTVTERVEDKAKKGKFTVVTGQKITKEKIHWHYSHPVAMAAIAVTAAVIIMISASLSKPIGASVYGFENYGRDYYAMSLFDDSVVISYIENTKGVTTTNLEIHDKALYGSLRYALSGYRWDAARKAYVKEFPFTWAGKSLDAPKVVGVSGGGKINVTPAKNGTPIGLSELTLIGTGNISEVTVAYGEGGEMKFLNDEKKESMMIRLPLEEGAFSVVLTYAAGQIAGQVEVVYRQYVWYPAQATLFTDRSPDFALISHYITGKDGQVRYGMYYEVAVGSL